MSYGVPVGIITQEIGNYEHGAWLFIHIVTTSNHSEQSMISEDDKISKRISKVKSQIKM